MIIYILKGLLIGLVSAIPVGPVLILAIQKSICDGRKAGLSCGLGGTTVDTVWAAVSALTLSAINEIIDKHLQQISLFGGIIVTIIGIAMIFKKVERIEKRQARKYSPKNYFRTMAMGFSNPAALAIMLALFAGFGMDFSQESRLTAILSVAAVAVGSASYWYTITSLIAKLGSRFPFRIIVILSRAAGCIIAGFGIFLFVKSLLPAA